MKTDELALWDAVAAGEWPRDAGKRLRIHPRRVGFLCAKWSRRGIYDYGVVVDMGWVTASAASGGTGKDPE